MNAADTAWMLISTALVLMMTPALGFFYAGMVRAKNALNTLMMSFAPLGFVGLAWPLITYSIAFSPGSRWAGGTGYALLHGVTLAPQGTVPHLLFMAYQGTFAIITAALISGAIVERMRFGAYVVFVTAWSMLVYAPLAHWVWGGGWLATLGALDFAGGTVVHINAAVAAVVVATVVGARTDYGRKALIPQNVPFTLLGTGLLWLGWFGFNGGSARGANAVAVSAVTVTHLTAVSAALAWMVAEWKHRGKPTVLGLASGAVAGLATSTAGAGFISPLAAVLMGIAAGICSYMAIVWKGKIGYDDTLDVMGTHGVGGMLGMVGVGLFAANGHLAMQVSAVVATAAFSFLGSYAILKLIDGAMGLRVSPEEEATGLDLTQHNERAYS